jgi:hypothetical protein
VGSLLRLINNSSPARRDRQRFPYACRVLADRSRRAPALVHRPLRRARAPKSGHKEADAKNLTGAGVLAGLA